MEQGFLSTREALQRPDGERVRLRGWVYRRRDLGGKIFIVLRDSEGIIQCVIEGSSKAAPEASKATIESSVMVEGIVRSDPRAPGGKEVRVEDFKVSRVSRGLPYQGR